MTPRRPARHPATHRALADGVERFGARRASAAWCVGDTLGEEQIGGEPIYGFGSVTKVFVAERVLEACTRGRWRLDAPLARLGEGITARHLLAHTSGLDGDFFHEPEQPGDLEAYVRAWRRSVPRMGPVGRRFSYCNAGFVALGAELERRLERPFDDVLRGGMVQRIASDSMTTAQRPGEFPLALAPAGSTLQGRALDLVRCARRWLGPERAALEAMIAPQVALPPDPWAHAWALGWQVGAWSGRRAVGHGGMTTRDCTSLWLFPDDGSAVAVTSEGGDAAGLHATVLAQVAQALLGVAPPQPIMAGAADGAVDAERLVGSFVRRGLHCQVEGDGAVGLTLRARPTDEVARFFSEEACSRLVPRDPAAEDDVFVVRGASSRPGLCAFLERDETGRATLLWSGRRLSRRGHRATSATASGEAA